MLNISTTPQSISQILRRGVRLWKQSFRQVVPFAGIFVIAYWSFELILHALNQTQSHDKSVEIISNNTGLLVGSSVLYIIISMVINVCMIYRMNTIASNTKIDFDTTLSKSFKKLFPFLVTGILYGIMVILGLLLFILPGIVAANYFLFSNYLIVTTEQGIIDSFRESYRLVLGNWWHTFGVLCIIILVGIIFGISITMLSMSVSFIISFVAKVMFQAELLHSMDYTSIIMDGISFIILYPLFYACILSLLYDLQARKLLKSTQTIQA